MMYISEVMTKNVRIGSPEDTLQMAAEMMGDCDFGILPIEDNNQLVGMLSDRDITIRAVAKGFSPNEHHVREIMTRDVQFIYEDETVEDAAQMMSSLQVRRLPVVDIDEHLVGIVSLGDLAISGDEAAGDALESISQPN
ncbi:MAG: CBS domain-containing protein [Methylotenera sp.]|uniref:CBS domain-containing protein n=1 Tax=Methylotenera sp. TaxID=2051956 RepID=UPI0024870F14|nr:CBS domain-containing protein [Methylotenera sp.]MDI1308982.1 CBS domain-containing protein [Methylotenera sp.]